MNSMTFPAALFAAILLAMAAPPTRSAEVINAGVGGNRTTHLLRRLEKDVLAHDPSLVVLMVGTNDRLNSGGFVSARDYRKHIETLVTRLQKSGSAIILVTPPPCLPELLFTRHDPEKFSDQSPEDRLREIRRILIEVGKQEAIPVADLHANLVEQGLATRGESSVIRNPANSGMEDGVHLTADGYRRLARLVADTIAENQLPTNRVICLGDSLTYGSGMKGAGTASGETYPAFLQLFLDGTDR